MFVDFVVAYANDNSDDYVMSDQELEDSERLLEIPHPGEMVKPHWTGSEWEELATPEEVEEKNNKENEAYNIETEDSNTEIYLALAELYENQLNIQEKLAILEKKY